MKHVLSQLLMRFRMLLAEDEVFYIGGTEVLPPPLEKEQEQKCLIALSGVHAPTAGQDTDNVISREDAKQMLIEHNLRLVVYLAKKFENTGICVEDLISIGTIGLIDDDVVSVTNLQRQVLYSEEEVGLSKALHAKKRLLSLNSSITVNAYPFRLKEENAREIIQEYDIIVDGTDNFLVRFLISDVCKELGKTYVYGAICGLEGQVAVLCKGNATYRTLFPDEKETLAMPHPGKQVVGVTPAVIGSVEASQVIMLICGYGEPLIDRLWSIDLRTMQSFMINI